MADSRVVVTGSRTFRNIADLDQPAREPGGVASSASVGAVTAAQLEARPIMRPGEVLESVPGFIVSQHSGEGKANQYYLRGFNLDHGSDFATTLAGVPLNESGAHAHGYTDVNQLIPELVSGVQYTKGPYFAEHGDFSAAGSANISFVNRLDRPLFSLSTGGQGWGRVLGAVSPRVAGGDLLMALELGRDDGPWELKNNMRKTNGVIRYSRGDRQNAFSLTAMGYDGHWNATDQIPRRAVEQGLITRFGNIDPTDAGNAFRHSLTFDGLRRSPVGSAPDGTSRRRDARRRSSGARVRRATARRSHRRVDTWDGRGRRPRTEARFAPNGPARPPAAGPPVAGEERRPSVPAVAARVGGEALRGRRRRELAAGHHGRPCCSRGSLPVIRGGEHAPHVVPHRWTTPRRWRRAPARGREGAGWTGRAPARPAARRRS